MNIKYKKTKAPANLPSTTLNIFLFVHLDTYIYMYQKFNVSSQ